MSLRRLLASVSLVPLAVIGLALCVPSASWAGNTFPPVSPEELKMTGEPAAPGAPAIILFRQVDRDDSGRGTAHEFNYIRIKILTEEGRKYADVELPYYKEASNIVHIDARTVKRDGSIVEFDGKVFDKSLVKGRQERFSAKTFTFPNVQVGDVIEYLFTVDLKYVYDSHWILSQELFTKNAQFSLKPYRGTYVPVKLGWSWQGLPPGSEPKKGPDGVIRMQASNIPAFQTEDFMPPENEMKSRVDFIYEEGLPDKDPDQYWRRIGKGWNGALENFVGKRKAMEQVVAQIVSPGDPPEIKLRKSYDRVQAIRNTSYEVSKTAQEEKRDKEKIAQNVEDIWKRGYGEGGQLTWLYLALVRAAGFEAYGCWVSSRGEYFFNPKMMQSSKLNANVVLVKLNGKDLYFDPGAAFTPFGMLEWQETGVPGLRLDKDGGTWITTTLPPSSESRIERKAQLKLSDTGDLEGHLVTTYTGLEAMYHRLDARHDDDVARKKVLEDLAKDQVPLAAEAELTNKPDWTGSDTPLVAEFDIKIPGWASSAGKHATIPAAIFTVHEKHMFEHANRVHPVYIDYPYEKKDDITVELPNGWQVTSVPPSQRKEGNVVSYVMKVENNKGALHLSRDLKIDFVLVPQEYYSALREFFQLVRTGDEEQIVLQPGSISALN
jgi:hypothetical protein